MNGLDLFDVEPGPANMDVCVLSFKGRPETRRTVPSLYTMRYGPLAAWEIADRDQTIRMLREDLKYQEGLVETLQAQLPPSEG
jgi:hypothetical protein